MRSREITGEHGRAQESTGEHWRSREIMGDHGRAQEIRLRRLERSAISPAVVERLGGGGVVGRVGRLRVWGRARRWV